MSKEIEKILEKREVSQPVRELLKEIDGVYEEKFLKSQEEVIKAREMCDSLFGKPFAEATTEEVEKVKAAIRGDVDGVSPDDVDFEKEFKKGEYGGFLLAMASANGDVERAKSVLKAWENNPTFKVKNTKSIEKAINSTSLNEGGAFTNTTTNDMAIKYLFNKEVMGKLGIFRVNMSGSAEEKFGRVNSGFIPLTFQEGGKVKKSTIKTGELFLKPKYRGGILPVQIQWLNTASPAAMQMLQANMINGMKQVREQDFFGGSGTGGEPRGLYKLAKTDNIFSSAGTTNADIIDDLSILLKNLEDNNIDVNAGATIMTGRRLEHLRSLRDEAGWIFREEINLGRLNGQPVYATNNADSDKMYYADFSKIMEGSNQTLSVEMFNEGSYEDTSGATKSLLQEYAKVLRVVMSYDFAAMYDGAISIMDTITWGD